MMSRMMSYQFTSYISLLIFTILLLFPAVLSTMRLSAHCSPACQHNLYCVSERTVCSFQNCPIVLTCLSESQLPHHLQVQLRQLREAMAAPAPSEAPPREGCPVQRLQETCVTQCQMDADCPQDHLCCNNGCGQVCRLDSRVSRAPKRGSCPRLLGGSEDSCDNGCQSDYDCSGLQKCCQSSCGMSCTEPCYHWLSRSSSVWQLSERCHDRRSTRRRSLSKRLRMLHREAKAHSRRHEVYRNAEPEIDNFLL